MSRPQLSLSMTDFLTVDVDEQLHSPNPPNNHHQSSGLWTPTVYSTMASPAIRPEDAPWVPTTTVVDYDAPSHPSGHSQSSYACIPGGLSQISLSSSDTSRSPTPELAVLPSGFSLSPPSEPAPKRSLLAPDQRHPYSISPSNTTALFTRASSVSSSSSMGPSNAKKSRAPPSGPISTKDFIPPDVSGLSKREARLVKNRAAAFLSRQRKREEFEGLEARVEVLEADNARLYNELDAYRSTGASNGSATASSHSSADAAALAAELAGLKRQLAARDAELKTIHSKLRGLVNVQEQPAAEREKATETEQELRELKSKMSNAEVVSEDKAASDADSDVTVSKKDGKSAGSVAFMVLLFSLSTLLTNGSSTAQQPVSSRRMSRPGMGHRRSDSQQFLELADALPSSLSSYTYPSSLPLTSGLSAASAFAGLASSDEQQDSETEQLRKAAEKAISGIKAVAPDEFEFEFDLPAASGSTEKVSVRVKAGPGLSLPSTASTTSSMSLTSSPTRSILPRASRTLFDETFPSPFEFRPDDDLDLDLDFTSSSNAHATSPTATVVASPVSLGKRKRVDVEITRAKVPRIDTGLSSMESPMWAAAQPMSAGGVGCEMGGYEHHLMHRRGSTAEQWGIPSMGLLGVMGV